MRPCCSFVPLHPTIPRGGWARWPYWLLLLACGCQPITLPPPDAREAAPEPAPRAADVPPFSVSELGGKTLLMHYMPWYTTPDVRGDWGSHWTGHDRQHQPDTLKENGLPDIWSHYHPLIGLYDSTDPDVLECQLLQMKLAGIDGVIADWYGISPIADYPEIHEATLALFDAAGRLGMTFAACFEDRTIELLVNWGQLQPDQIAGHLADTFAWMQAEWFEKPHYHRVHDRPLLLNFGPIYVREAEVWNAARDALPVRPLFFALHHLWRQAGADGGFTWVHYEPWDGTPTPESIRRRLGEVFTYFTKDPTQAIVSAYPGFNDVYVERHRELDHRDGDTLRETIEVGLAGPWEIIQLVTWNDYGEGTMIEPTHEFGYLFLEILQEARRAEVGDAFAFTSEDLRLPAQLLALRKEGQVEGAQLDRVAALLAGGAISEARQELASLAGQPAP